MTTNEFRQKLNDLIEAAAEAEVPETDVIDALGQTQREVSQTMDRADLS